MYDYLYFPDLAKAWKHRHQSTKNIKRQRPKSSPSTHVSGSTSLLGPPPGCLHLHLYRLCGDIDPFVSRKAV